jgi:hypothetical protein
MEITSAFTADDSARSVDNITESTATFGRKSTTRKTEVDVGNGLSEPKIDN